MHDSNEWQEEVVFHEGDLYFADLIKSLEGAKKSIELETYIFDHDALGALVLKALCDAARRGVRVRLLLDGVGSSNWSFADTAKLRESGANVRFFHPLPWQNPEFNFFESLRIRRLLLGIFKLNRRNHRKSCLIDQEVAYIGGMNISARHMARYSSKKAVRDTSVRVRGETLDQLLRAYNFTFNHPTTATFKFRRQREYSIRSTLLRFNITRKQRVNSHQDLLQRIFSAQKRIWITNPYFVPDLALIRALRFAAWAGKDVRLLLPLRTDIPGFKLAVNAFYLTLLTAKVQIFEYQPSFLHAKTMLIDDWATVGSSNLNHRSLYYDLEIDAVLNHPESVQSLEKQFVLDLTHSKQIDINAWSNRFWVTRLLERVALLFRRWL